MHPDQTYQPAADERPEHRAARRTEGNEGEEALAGFRRVHVVGKGPKLGDHHQAEDADPQEERDANREAALGKRVENGQARDEEKRDQVDEPAACHSRGEDAVKRHCQGEEQGLGAQGIALDLRAPRLGEDQRLARGLHYVVGGQDQEDGQRQKHELSNLAGPDVREEAEDPFQRAVRPRGWRGGSAGCGQGRSCRGGARSVGGHRCGCHDVPVVPRRRWTHRRLRRTSAPRCDHGRGSIATRAGLQSHSSPGSASGSFISSQTAWLLIPSDLGRASVFVVPRPE